MVGTLRNYYRIFHSMLEAFQTISPIARYCTGTTMLKGVPAPLKLKTPPVSLGNMYRVTNLRH